MSKLRLDFRKILREIGNRAQDENLERLLSGRTVRGEEVAQRAPDTSGQIKGSKRRVRIFGVKTSVRDLAGNVGVKTGDMLKDVARRSNVKVSRLSFHITPGESQRLKWFVFVRGSTRSTKSGANVSTQPARPVSGMSGDLITESRAQIATAARDQFVAAANQRARG